MVTIEDMSFATEQVVRIETLLAENPGVKSVVVGNTTVTYEDLLKQYDYWKIVRTKKPDGVRAQNKSTSVAFDGLAQVNSTRAV